MARSFEIGKPRAAVGSFPFMDHRTLDQVENAVTTYAEGAIERWWRDREAPRQRTIRKRRAA